MTHNKKNLTFNIIFIPGTVNYQALGVVSLLLNTNLNFQLVGNSLNDCEMSLLEKISKTSPRLTSINFESEQVIPHGTLLDLLFLTEKSRYFCFCDSDIFLFNELIQSNILYHLASAAVFSTGGRIENEEEAVYAGFKGGATTKSPDGDIDLATSFFCIYRRKPLQKVMDKYKVGFEQYRLDSQIPEQAMSIVRSMNLEYEMFDTGKLLSVLFHHDGYNKSFKEMEGLVHIGGMSGRYLQEMNLSKTIVLDDTELPKKSRTQGEDFNFRNEYEICLKRLYGKYFYCFLNYLIGKGQKPMIKTEDKRVLKTIAGLEQNIRHIWEKAQHVDEVKNITKLLVS